VRYQLYDFALETDTVLPELRATARPPDRRDLRLRVGGSRPQAMEADWFVDWRLPDGTEWARAGRTGGALLLRFAGLADFLLSAGAKRLDAFPAPGVPPVTVRHLCLDQVLPLLVSHRGGLVLHASAVAVPGGAIAFLGEAGAGKSTLAASFWAAGHPVVADDALLVAQEGDQVVGEAAYAGLRLWTDVLDVIPQEDRGAANGEIAHYSDKRRIGPSGHETRFLTGPVRLVSLYVLSPGDPAVHVGLAQPSPRDALMSVVRHAYRLDVRDRAALAAQLDRIAGVLRGVPVRRLCYPRTLDRLPDVRRAILEDLAAAGEGEAGRA
jgi:hypothetical protein